MSTEHDERSIGFMQGVGFMLFLFIFWALFGCHTTYQVMDGKRVPMHPNDTIGAQFPIIQPRDSSHKVHSRT